MKNSVEEALVLHKKGISTFSAAEAEYAFYNWTNNMLELAGVNLTRGVDSIDCAGIPFIFGPKILLEPSFALTL